MNQSRLKVNNENFCRRELLGRRSRIYKVRCLIVSESGSVQRVSLSVVRAWMEHRLQRGRATLQIKAGRRAIKGLGAKYLDVKNDGGMLTVQPYVVLEGLVASAECWKPPLGKVNVEMRQPCVPCWAFLGYSQLTFDDARLLRAFALPMHTEIRAAL